MLEYLRKDDSYDPNDPDNKEFNVHPYECRTTGCDCCSTKLHPIDDKEQILNEAYENLEVVEAVCKFYNISMTTLTQIQKG